MAEWKKRVTNSIVSCKGCGKRVRFCEDVKLEGGGAAIMINSTERRTYYEKNERRLCPECYEKQVEFEAGSPHELKTLPEYYDAVINGYKTFEVRKNDRDYKVGDLVNLREYYPKEGYSGRNIWLKITYTLDDPKFVKTGYVIFGIGRNDGGDAAKTKGD